jgi:hypothetical protein
MERVTAELEGNGDPVARARLAGMREAADLMAVVVEQLYAVTSHGVSRPQDVSAAMRRAGRVVRSASSTGPDGEEGDKRHGERDVG